MLDQAKSVYYWRGDELAALVASLPADHRAGAIAHALQRVYDGAGGNIAAVFDHAADVPDAMWAAALYLIENPIPTITPRKNVIDGAAKAFGPTFAPVADLLLSFPPLADDASLQAIAAGRPSPSISEIVAARRAKATASASR